MQISIYCLYYINVILLVAAFFFIFVLFGYLMTSYFRLTGPDFVYLITSTTLGIKYHLFIAFIGEENISWAIQSLIFVDHLTKCVLIDIDLIQGFFDINAQRPKKVRLCFASIFSLNTLFLYHSVKISWSTVRSLAFTKLRIHEYDILVYFFKKFILHLPKI